MHFTEIFLKCRFFFKFLDFSDIFCLFLTYKDNKQKIVEIQKFFETIFLQYKTKVPRTVAFETETRKNAI